MPHNLTRRQYQVLETIKRLGEKKNFMPSVRELASEINLSPATTQQHLTALKQKGYLTTTGSAHGIKLLVEDKDDALEGSPNASVVAIPIVGTIAAGRPIEALEVLEDPLLLTREMARPGDYLLHVRGDSMIDDGILNGDLVLIHPQPSVENGETAVGLLQDGCATLKKVYREGGRIRLQPANRAMAPIFVDRIQIQGRVVGLIRRYL